MNNRNQPEKLPYEKLALLGLGREKADKLPEDVKRKLVTGQVTPLMQVSLSARNGDTITLPLKLQMVADRNGQPALIAYPVKPELDKDKTKELKLTDAEADRLKKGEVIQKSVEQNGEKTKRYLQLDPETKSVIHRNVADIKLEQKLKDMEFQCKANPIERARIGEPQPEIAPQKVNDIELGMQQKQQVRDGKPVELNVGGEKVSVGIDLKEPQGFKIIKGDMKEWDRQQKMRYDELHPEYYGFVQTDKNRWEYQQVVDKQSVERAFKLKPSEEVKRSNSLKR